MSWFGLAKTAGGLVGASTSVLGMGGMVTGLGGIGGDYAKWAAGLPKIAANTAGGTAFNIAGKGQADPQSMCEAIKLASKLST